MFASEWWLYAVPLGWKVRRHDSGRAATDGSALFFRSLRAASKASWLFNASLRLEGSCWDVATLFLWPMSGISALRIACGRL